MIDTGTIPLPFFNFTEGKTLPDDTFYVVDFVHPESRGDSLHMDIGYARNIVFNDLQFAIQTAEKNDALFESDRKENPDAPHGFFSVGVFVGVRTDDPDYEHSFEVYPKGQGSLVWANGDIEKMKEVIE